MFDPFGVLGLEKCFPLNLKDLETKYFEAQKKSHPDHFMLASQDERTQSSQRSTEINQAYLILKDPLQRALSLLKSEGIDLLDHNSETLTKVMMWRERLEAGEDLVQELKHEESILMKDLETGFETKNYEKVKLTHYQLTYVQKMLNEIKVKNYAFTNR